MDWKEFLKKIMTILILVAIILSSGCTKQEPDTSIPTTTQETQRPPITDKTGFLEILNRGKKVQTITYEIHTSSSFGKVWMKMDEDDIPDYRIEFYEPSKYTIIVYDNSHYFKTEASDFYIKKDFSEVDMTLANEYLDIILEGADIEIKGEEIIDGKKCTNVVFQYKDSVNEICYWNEYGFPLKSQIIWSTPQEDVESITYYKNFVIDEPIPDSMFEVPVDKIQEMPI